MKKTSGIDKETEIRINTERDKFIPGINDPCGINTYKGELSVDVSNSYHRILYHYVLYIFYILSLFPKSEEKIKPEKAKVELPVHENLELIQFCKNFIHEMKVEGYVYRNCCRTLRGTRFQHYHFCFVRL
eukprot:TRINITY_DN1137_c0_g1_i7.p1 TRINITY_DN1137_c0_g1~~TRINITY_DN1137_c0_g1_i7.p1  ORF type:complete len:130 (+),score=15.08 TRINITY_DN1137_c0_g1_i7:1046-1435(+)